MDMKGSSFIFWLAITASAFSGSKKSVGMITEHMMNCGFMGISKFGSCYSI